MTESSATVSLDRLKAVRGGHWGMLTRLTNELDGLLTVAPAEAPDKVGRMKILNQQLENKLTILQKYDDKILALCNVDEIEREIGESDTISKCWITRHALVNF